MMPLMATATRSQRRMPRTRPSAEVFCILSLDGAPGLTRSGKYFADRSRVQKRCPQTFVSNVPCDRVDNQGSFRKRLAGGFAIARKQSQATERGIDFPRCQRGGILT